MKLYVLLFQIDSSLKPLIEGSASNNKSDKWKVEKPLKWLLNSSSMHQFYSTNNHFNGSSSNNGTLVSKSSHVPHHGSVTLPKKTDAPMLNLVYDSHIKQRHLDFR